MTEIRTEEQRNELAECLLDMGALLLDCGAEISRVEDTICRMGTAYGALHVDVFVITSIISLSMEFADEENVTITRRIYSSAGNDFYRLEKLNELSRQCCAEPFELGELRGRIRDVASGKKPPQVIILGNLIATAAFTIFFGGTVWDGLAAAFFAAGICALQLLISRTQLSVTGSNLMISLIIGLCAGAVCMMFPQLHMDKILIGDIMLLIPGLAMTNAIRNLLTGNTISGVVRLTETLIWAGALAGGFMIAILLLEQFG